MNKVPKKKLPSFDALYDQFLSVRDLGEGSRAFPRYRTIDIDMKKDLVKILEGKG